MKRTAHPIRKKGFTLIELLTVIAIIGILASMISVIVPIIQDRAARLNASNNCKQIALAYTSFANDSTPRTIPASVTSVTDWAVYLATKTDLNNAAVWFNEKDDQIAAVTSLPIQIINLKTKTPDSAFQSLLPKAWEVVAAAPKGADINTYPILWTRGLEGQEWSKTNSPWKGKGGHIGFMDGHVLWGADTNGDDGRGVFTDYTEKTQTTEIDRAIGSVAKRLRN